MTKGPTPKEKPKNDKYINTAPLYFYYTAADLTVVRLKGQGIINTQFQK